MFKQIQNEDEARKAIRNAARAGIVNSVLIFVQAIIFWLLGASGWSLFLDLLFVAFIVTAVILIYKGKFIGVRFLIYQLLILMLLYLLLFGQAGSLVMAIFGYYYIKGQSGRAFLRGIKPLAPKTYKNIIVITMAIVALLVVGIIIYEVIKVSN